MGLTAPDLNLHFDFQDPVAIDVVGLPSINVGLGIKIDPLELKLDPLELKIDPLDIKVEPLDIKVEPLDIKVEPLDMSFRIKEIPSVRVHFPVDYRFCVALLGTELMSLQICGQGQVITEPYVPNPCECRGVQIVRSVDQPLTPVETA
jgi:hypothetical protein